MAPSDIIARMQAAATAHEGQELGARETLLSLNRELLAELETPTEFLQRLYFSTASLAGCLATAVDAKLFHYLKNADRGLSTEALAEKTGIEVSLLGRFMRHFAAHKVVCFTKADGWQATPLSNAFCQESYEHGVAFCHHCSAKSFQQFPNHFKQAGYRHPGSSDGPFQHCNKSPLPFFEWLVANPPFVQHFASFMSVYRAGGLDWWKFYPVSDRLITGFDKTISDALLVDVGGGWGHDLALFAAAYPCQPGRLILQDKPEVIASVKKDATFEPQTHDFFTPQIAKGARAYYLHSVMHNWSDENSVKILGNLKPALVPGYSKVLINEIVLSNEKPSVPGTSMDMMILGHVGDSRERTEDEWRGIAEEAGLVMLSVFSNPASSESIVELGLPEVEVKRPVTKL